MWRAWWAALVAAAALGGGGALGRQPPQPLCPPVHGCEAINPGSEKPRFKVKGIEVAYDYIDSSFFDLECPPHIALDDAVLPHFKHALHVRSVWLRNCWPRVGSYAAALSALNLTAAAHVAPTPGPATAPPIFFIYLDLDDVRNFDSSVLAVMSNLKELTISYTNLTVADLALLPVGLERLEIVYTTIAHVSAAILTHLPRLVELIVEDSEPVVVEVAGDLGSLTAISSATTLVSLLLPDSLENLELQGWTPRCPQPWTSCAGLDTLTVNSGTTETLPDGWLARCTRLRKLVVKFGETFTSLQAGALRGATALVEVHFTANALEALPAGLFDDALALRVLKITENRLHTLPSELFKSLKILNTLDLSGNNLTVAALGALGPVTSLRILRLAHNPALDTCPHTSETDIIQSEHDVSSPLRDLKNLTELSLAGTSTRNVCVDWRQLPWLRELDLSHTPITRLTFADLQFQTHNRIRIDVTYTNITRLILSRKDYKSAAAAPAARLALILQLEKKLRCDCELYWAAAALRLPNTRWRVEGAMCDDGLALREVQLQDLVCTAAAGTCPPGCACVTREDTARPGPLLQLHCAGAGLPHVPHLNARAALRYTGAEPVALDLRLADNRIDRLGPEDLPPELVALDLRNNSLGLIDAETAVAFVSRADRRMLLAGNPLECGCRAASALETVRENLDMFSDWADATCSDGTALALAAPQPCEHGSTDQSINVPESSTPNGRQSVSENVSGGMSGGAAAAVALGVVVMILMLAVGLVLVRPSLRLRLRAALRAARRPRHPSILQLERRRPESGEWTYDAFISFAHADEAIVHELVSRLEGGEAPLRLCVHYRDWVPGGWIPAQIAASVRVSRRTVAVVSEAFLRSKWARAEFREAYAAALEDTEPRLVLVLLEDPTRLRLDSELAAYISGNTYVRWGDSWFWQKLRQALPTPSARPAAEEATPASRGPSPLFFDSQTPY